MSILQFKTGLHNDEVLLKISGASKLTRNGLRHAFFDVGKELKDTANKEILRKPKGGRTYVIRTASGRKRRHTASAPGETHANMSGAARRSIGWVVRGHQQLEFGYGAAGDETPAHVAFIERGTSRMAARPTLRNAIRASERNTVRSFQNRIVGAFE